jgi:hypothetical protein
VRGRVRRGSGPGGWKGPIFLVILFSFTFQTFGQNAARTTAPGILPDTKSSSDFPLWAKDLRRGEIIAFGSFPFTMFTSTFAVDTVRYFQHDRRSEYLPWPFKGAGAVETSRDDREKALVIAIAASVAIAVIDFTIVQIKRNREKKMVERQNNGGEQIRITRSPLAEDDVEEEEETPEIGEDPAEENP